jgi:hypothetical protein
VVVAIGGPTCRSRASAACPLLFDPSEILVGDHATRLDPDLTNPPALDAAVAFHR